MVTTATEANKRVIEEAFEAINEGRLEVLAEHPGFWETRQVIPEARQAFVDWRTRFTEQIAEGDRVFTHFAVEFTHAGPFGGVPATGRRVCLEGFSLDQVVNGIVVEHNSTTSWADVMRQLGAPAFAGWPARAPHPLGDRAPSTAGNSSSTAANKAAVAWLLRALSRGEEVAQPPAPGSGALWEEFAAIRAAFPDLAYTPVYQLAEGDRAAMRATLRGTHTGTLFGLAPTGKAIVWDVFCLARVAGGTVVEVCGSADWGAGLGQLGLLPG